MHARESARSSLSFARYWFKFTVSLRVNPKASLMFLSFLQFLDLWMNIYLLLYFFYVVSLYYEVYLHPNSKIKNHSPKTVVKTVVIFAKLIGFFCVRSPTSASVRWATVAPTATSVRLTPAARMASATSPKTACLSHGRASAIQDGWGCCATSPETQPTPFKPRSRPVRWG